MFGCSPRAQQAGVQRRSWSATRGEATIGGVARDSAPIVSRTPATEGGISGFHSTYSGRIEPEKQPYFSLSLISKEAAAGVRRRERRGELVARC